MQNSKRKADDALGAESQKKPPRLTTSVTGFLQAQRVREFEAQLQKTANEIQQHFDRQEKAAGAAGVRGAAG